MKDPKLVFGSAKTQITDATYKKTKKIWLSKQYLFINIPRTLWSNFFASKKRGFFSTPQVVPTYIPYVIMPVYTDAVHCKYSNIGRDYGKEHISPVAGGMVPTFCQGWGGRSWSYWQQYTPYWCPWPGRFCCLKEGTTGSLPLSTLLYLHVYVDPKCRYQCCGSDIIFSDPDPTF